MSTQCLNRLRIIGTKKEEKENILGFLKDKENNKVLINPLNLIAEEDVFWEGIDSSKYVYHTEQLNSNCIEFITRISSIPEDWVLRLSKKFPKATFELMYGGLGDGNCGHLKFKNGEVVFEDETLYDDDKKAHRFGMRLWGFWK